MNFKFSPLVSEPEQVKGSISDAICHLPFAIFRLVQSTTSLMVKTEPVSPRGDMSKGKRRIKRKRKKEKDEDDDDDGNGDEDDGGLIWREKK